MKRDMDLVRDILLLVAAKPPTGGVYEDDFAVSGHADEEVQYHLRLLNEAGLLRAFQLEMQERVIPLELTWAGHDALDAMRDSKVWQAAKDHVLKPLGGATFAVLFGYLEAKAKEYLGLKP